MKLCYSYGTRAPHVITRKVIGIEGPVIMETEGTTP
jgi:hypothetical protein